jgi:hypothetical protein
MATVISNPPMSVDGFVAYSDEAGRWRTCATA